MSRFILKPISRPLKNQRGAAALMGVILGIVIMAAVAFNFLAESRQKQAGSILTYTSTNAFMIAEAGLRYAEGCLTKTEATCPSGVNGQSDWTDIDNSDNIGPLDFGGGTFSIYFPGSTDPANATGSPNDQDNIRVISVGTYKGAERSIQRFIQRACFLSVSGATSCLGTTTANNSDIDPDPPANAEGVCGEIVDDLDPTDDFTDTNCAPGCDGTDTECPNFDDTNTSHYNATTDRLLHYKFCDLIIDTNNLDVLTSDDNTSDNHIAVAGNLTIEDSTLKISDDASTFVNTFSVTTINEIDVSGHPYSDDEQVSLTTTGTLPTGLNTGTSYYVINSGTNDFQLSLTSGGSAVSIAVDGSGTHTVSKVVSGTTITVYGNALIAGTGELRLNGTLTLNVGGTYIMENATAFNVVQGNASDASVWVEGNVTVGNSADFIGALASDGTITVQNNADITGAIQAQTVTLQNNAEIDFEEDAGENTEGYEQCGSSDVSSAWAE